MTQTTISNHKALELLEFAREVMKNSYTPYSNFHVGAALLCKDSVPTGDIVQGCNVENVSYGLSICAERTAITKAVSLGYREFTAIAIVASEASPCYPCGTCLQFIREFGPEIIVILQDHNGAPIFHKISDLIPYAFTSEELKRYED